MKKPLKDLYYGEYYIYQEGSSRVHQKLNVAKMRGKNHCFTLECENGHVFEMDRDIEVFPLSLSEACTLMIENNPI